MRGPGEAAIAFVRETDPYPQTRDTLESFWAKERQIEPLAVEVTAPQGSRASGGRWTRPDLVSVTVRTYRYLPGKYMEVVTFEPGVPEFIYQRHPCLRVDASMLVLVLAEERLRAMRSSQHGDVFAGHRHCVAATGCSL